jgi:hypothetical protein
MNVLNKVVESGFTDDTLTNQLIDIVGLALPVSCTQTNCYPEIDEQLIEERRDNFNILIHDILALPELLTTTQTGSGSIATTTGSEIEIDDSSTTLSTSSATLPSAFTEIEPETGSWYPLYSTDDFEHGMCIDSSPTPIDVSTFFSELQCCVEFFSAQVDDHCLNQLHNSRNPSNIPTFQPVVPLRLQPTNEPTHHEAELITLPSSAFGKNSVFVLASLVFSLYFACC